jgi:hypothetical protein
LRILIFTHHGSRISDPKTATKERSEKKFVVISFFVAKFQKIKIENYFIFDGGGKKVKKPSSK